MNFDLYHSYKNSKGKHCPGVRSIPSSIDGILSTMDSPRVKELVEAYRGGDAEAKKQLPGVVWTGRSKSGRRRDAEMELTQFVFIDIDHCDDPRGAWKEIEAKAEIPNPLSKGKCWIALAHITCSGKGLRIIFRASEPIDSLYGQMQWFKKTFECDKYGKFDDGTYNAGRLSFLVPRDEILYINTGLLNGSIEVSERPVKVPCHADEVSVDHKAKKAEAEAVADEDSYELPFDEVQVFTDREREQFDAFRYRGFELPVIIKKYLEVFGEPGPGERHNYYNQMVKYFRCITENNKRLLLYYLPAFDHDLQERWSQIVSICRVNTLSSIPKPFYFFLKDHGFYVAQGGKADDLKKQMLDETETLPELPPYLPPVFREIIGTAPADFVLPCMNALLPILGTLTSYLRADYPYDNREHSTSFFSVIYAPPGTGKGFVEPLLDLLFKEIDMRDMVSSFRENVYLRVIQKKGANDKSPDMPHVSLRKIPPKNSEAEFLQKQSDNGGFHMFTYAAEMDSWAKGVRAAGGNKDDMIRIAWDNGTYGQQFKSANTFKGEVRLYWNVLITGTIAQVEKYFQNVENGLVTRCSFTSIENQEFQEAPKWKKITKRGLDVIEKFCKRCDDRTYETPCTVTVDDLVSVNDDDFDKEIDWRFKFRPKRKVDLSWIMPTIEAFHKKHISLAARDIDRARDVFRRRVGVRGFRLALLCEGLWDKMNNKNREDCKKFINWWMERDLESILKLWGARYNEQTEVYTKVTQRNVFDKLDDKFSRNDVYNVCIAQSIKTPVRRIIFEWKKISIIEQLDKEHFKKNKKNGNK